jgi:hypothetical protein
MKQRIPKADWTSLSPHRSMAFVKLAKGVRPEQVNAAFAAYVAAHVKFRRKGVSLSFYLQPLLTVGFQAARAAMVNPIENLRNE